MSTFSSHNLSHIADYIMYACAGADCLVAILYALDHKYWKALYWFAAFLIVIAVTKMVNK